ncbi:MAG: deoxyribonuclease IV [Patescibacteria group bacterium]|nr:deoxyribonuclease IV [Patescibacteria group bacterium]
MIKIGCHVSIAEGIEKAPRRAHDIGCECFQFFSRSPYGGSATGITQDNASKFISSAEKYGFTPWRDYVIHAPYFVNLASKDSRIYYGSINALRKELETALLVKALYVIIHIGSSKDMEEPDIQKQINEKVLKALRKIHDGYEGKAMLLLEITAGSGNIIGDTFEEIGYFIKKMKEEDIKIGFCLDTCHGFAAGYDFSDPQKVRKIFTEIDKEIGLDNLKCVHFNDSQAEFDSHVDRHEHIGKGKIGINGLEETIRLVKNYDINLIIETGHDKIREDLAITGKMRALAN